MFNKYHGLTKSHTNNSFDKLYEERIRIKYNFKF